MMFSKQILAAVLAFSASTAYAAPQAASQTTEATPQQTAQFLAALKSYYSSFLSSPAATSLGINLAINVPASALQSITQNLDELLPVATTNFDLESIATNPPLTFPTPAWQSDAGTNIANQVHAVETSAALEVAQIAQSVLSTSVSLRATATGTESGNFAARETGVTSAAMGAAAVAIGAAAILL